MVIIEQPLLVRSGLPKGVAESASLPLWPESLGAGDLHHFVDSCHKVPGHSCA
mgnify:CR=1 FL=1